jgi:hypothetical protein
VIHVNSFRSATIQQVHLLAIRRLERREHPNIARPRSVSCVRRLAAKNNIIFEAVSDHVLQFVGVEAIHDKDTGFTASSKSGGRIEDPLHPIQIDGRIHVPSVAASVVPIRGPVRYPRVLQRLTGPDDKRGQTPLIRRDTFDSSDHGAAQSNTTTTLHVATRYKDLYGIEIAKQYAGLVHIVHSLL